MYFILTPYKLVVKTNIDLTTATSLTIVREDPFYNNPQQWTATANGKNAEFDIDENEIPRRGTYKMQLIADFSGTIRRSANFFSVTFEIPIA